MSIKHNRKKPATLARSMQGCIVWPDESGVGVAEPWTGVTQ